MTITSSIASAYDLLADRWSDTNFNIEDGVSQLRHALGFLGETRLGWALNVGCGCNTRFNQPIKSMGLRLEGVDISPRMVAMANAADPDVTVHHADVCTWRPTRQYSFICAWDSLWHVPLVRQKAVMQKLLSALEPGGVFLFTAGGLDAPSEHTDAHMGPMVYYATLGIPGLLASISQSECICKHLEFDQFPQTHLCVIAQRPPRHGHVSFGISD